MFTEIKSKDNIKIKNLRKLGNKKYRQERGEFLVENWTIIFDATQSGILFESLFITEEFLKKNKKEVDIVLKKSGEDNVYLISSAINKSFSELDNPAGVTAVYKKQEKEIDYSGHIIYLNGISDPGNLGTILRSALAFDLKNIIMDEVCVELYNPKVIQASKDAIFKLNFAFDKNKKVLNKIKKAMPIFSTDVNGGKEIGGLVKKNKKFCLILGNESAGVDEKIKKMSAELINIKTGDKIESLNVAVSAGIIFSEIKKNS